MQNSNNTLKYFTLFIIGGITYYFMEIVYRGYSHFSMIIVGGICFILIGAINEVSNKQIPLLLQMILSVLIVDTIELISGIFLNRILLLNIWDYSNLRFNFLGQVSLRSSIAWFFLSILAIYMDDLLRYLLFNEQIPKYKFLYKN